MTLGLGARGASSGRDSSGACGLWSEKLSAGSAFEGLQLGDGCVPWRPVAQGLLGGPSLCSSSASPTASSGPRRRAGQQSTAPRVASATTERGPQFPWPCPSGAGGLPTHVGFSCCSDAVQPSASTVCRAARIGGKRLRHASSFARLLF